MIIANWKSNMVDIFQWNNDFYDVYILNVLDVVLLVNNILNS